MISLANTSCRQKKSSVRRLLTAAHFIFIHVCFFSLFFFMPASLAAQEQPLRFGIFPTKSPKTILQLYLPIAKRLEAATGRKVRVVTSKSPAAFMARAKAAKFDLILPCTPCYPPLEKQVGYQAIARAVPGFRGGVIVRKDSGINNLQDLRGKRILSYAPYAIGAYLFLKLELLDLGFDQEVSFSFLPKLDDIIIAVVSRSVGAGTIRIDAMSNPALVGASSQLKVIFRSEIIPQFPFAVHPRLAPELVAQIRQTLTSFDHHNPEDQAILDALLVQDIIPATATDYQAFWQKYGQTFSQGMRQ